MAPISPVPASVPAVVIQVDPSRCEVTAAAPMGRSFSVPAGAVVVNGNYFWQGRPIGVIVANGRSLVTLPLKQSRALLVIQRGKAVILRLSPGEVRDRQQSGAWKDATVIQGGTLLVENGKVCLAASLRQEGFRSDVARATDHTAIGITKQGKLLLVFVRNRGLLDVARIMQRLGSVVALNLDGGGSASLRHGARTWGSWPPRTALLFTPTAPAPRVTPRAKI